MKSLPQLWFWLILLLLTCVTSLASADTLARIALEEQKAAAIQCQQVAMLIKFAGVTDLCSPSSDELIHFPKCDDSSTFLLHESSSSLRRRQERRHDAYNDNDADNEDNAESHSRIGFIIDGIGSFVCVFGAALASGLTIGLLSLDPIVLLMKSRASTDETERKEAESVLPLIQHERRHLLLVTLLLLNTSASEALPMFLHGMCPEFLAVFLAIVLVLVFGEIIPIAFFTSSNQVKMAASCSTIAHFLMILLYPLAYPIFKCLASCTTRTKRARVDRQSTTEMSWLL